MRTAIARLKVGALAALIAAATACTEGPVEPLQVGPEQGVSLSVDALSAAGPHAGPLASTPLSVSLTGPSDVDAHEWCTWWASVSGGTPPYTYDWSVSGTGYAWASSGNEFSVMADPGSMRVEVTVLDAGTGLAWATKRVWVHSGPAFPCSK
jgi:hypothetical protein